LEHFLGDVWWEIFKVSQSYDKLKQLCSERATTFHVWGMARTNLDIVVAVLDGGTSPVKHKQQSSEVKVAFYSRMPDTKPIPEQ